MITNDTVIAIEAFATKTHALLKQHLHKVNYQASKEHLALRSVFVKPEQIRETVRITTQLEDALRNQQLRNLEQEIQSQQDQA